MPLLKFNSIIKKFQFFSILFGICMGIISPLYANLFIREWKSTLMFFIFNAGCIVAGIMVGVMSYVIFRITILKILKDLSGQLNELAQGDGDLTKKLIADYNDTVGILSTSFNLFVDKIRDIIIRIKKVNTILNNSATTLSLTSENLSEASGTQRA